MLCFVQRHPVIRNIHWKVTVVLNFYWFYQLVQGTATSDIQGRAVNQLKLPPPNMYAVLRIVVRPLICTRLLLKETDVHLPIGITELLQVKKLCLNW